MNKVLVLLFTVTMTLQAGAQQIMGFTPANAGRQLEWEKKFDTLLNAANQDAWMKFLTSHPHHVGSPQGKANADYMADLFRQWGYQTSIEEYYVLFPTPKLRQLEIVGNKNYKARLQEQVLAADKTSGQLSEQLPPYNAYSADGDVTAELVFVNRGVPADYEELKRRGIDVKGKIVIAKYGGSWRGIKPKVAAEHGAVGCIIYSDPADDGFAIGDTYPEGGYRPGDGVQRGSVMDMPVYPGDPLTPDRGATKDARRLDRSEAATIMKIPVLPISWNDALPLLQTLKGEVVPAAWRGALPITYHTGPSQVKVHLKLAFNWDIKPLYNVIAKMPGKLYPDEWVIAGNHHDGWVNGAADPVSGLVAEMDAARVIGELVKKGLQLKRTVIFCAWDGEEPALLGSTEWTEDHQVELSEKAVAYINTDGNGRGFINAGGSHIYEPFFNEIMDQVIDPETGVSIKERKYAQTIVNADKSGRGKLIGNSYMKLSALGAGSDWGGFLQHIGISSFNMGFGGESEGDQYHSTYDSYDFFTRFIDPGFRYGVTLSKTSGRTLLRLANADVLPVDFKSFYTTVNEYTTEIKAQLEKSRTEAEEEARMRKEKLFDLARDPGKTYDAPALKDAVPFLDWSSLENELVQLKAVSDEFQQLYLKAAGLSTEKQASFNAILYKAERSLLLPDGLPRRTWYRHQVYAPGYYTGYGVKTLPGIREAVEQRFWKEAQENIERMATTLKAYTEKVKAATEMLK